MWRLGRRGSRSFIRNGRDVSNDMYILRDSICSLVLREKS